MVLAEDRLECRGAASCARKLQMQVNFLVEMLHLGSLAIILTQMLELKLINCKRKKVQASLREEKVLLF